MAEDNYQGPERRNFIRLDFVKPLAYKICKKETIEKLLQGYTANISQTGLFCNLEDKIKLDDILWLSFDRDTLSICHDMERRSVIYQNGIIGKVVRSQTHDDGSCEVGVQFITREEKNKPETASAIELLKESDDQQNKEP
ncbi:MAG: PilZ domain-containing protein [Candidatus Omnitrophota bacterium]